MKKQTVVGIILVIVGGIASFLTIFSFVTGYFKISDIIEAFSHMGSSLSSPVSSSLSSPVSSSLPSPMGSLLPSPMGSSLPSDEKTKEPQPQILNPINNDVFSLNDTIYVNWSLPENTKSASLIIQSAEMKVSNEYPVDIKSNQKSLLVSEYFKVEGWYELVLKINGNQLSEPIRIYIGTSKDLLISPETISFTEVNDLTKYSNGEDNTSYGKLLANAQILLYDSDNQLIANPTYSYGEYIINNILPGEYTLAIQYNGYRDVSRQITLEKKDIIRAPYYYNGQPINKEYWYIKQIMIPSDDNTEKTRFKMQVLDSNGHPLENVSLRLDTIDFRLYTNTEADGFILGEYIGDNGDYRLNLITEPTGGSVIDSKKFNLPSDVDKNGTVVIKFKQ